VLFAATLVPVCAVGAVRGDVVPFFKGVDTLGKPVNLGELVARKRVAVLFWDWRRATSTRALQTLDRLQAAYASRGFEVVAVEGEGSSAEQVLERLEKLRAIGIGPRYAIVPDPGGRIARQFRVDGTPRIFLIDGAGRLQEHFEDFRAEDEASLEQSVRELVGLGAPSKPAAKSPVAPPPPPPPPPPTTPAATAAPEDPSRALLEKYGYFGSYHLNKNEPAKAEEYFRKYVELAPTDVAAWLRLGEACARQGRYDQAREAWERVLRLEPGNAEADANIRRLIRGEY
jgi:tetratricopeptide (TPR) repeat protein